MIFRYVTLVWLTFSLLLACSNTDDETDSLLDFYSGAKTTTTTNNLLGTWAIFKVGYDKVITDVPIAYQNCGRDFIVFSENDVYSEYLYLSSDCNYTLNTHSWKLSNGVIRVFDSQNDSDELVITQISANELVVKSRFDVDDDGKLDIITAYLQRYNPPIKKDWVSETFMRNTSETAQHLISYTWQPYTGSETFGSYQIYRSIGANCSKEGAVLIKTITDVKVSEFTDLTPPIEDRICYYLKTNLASGVLGESNSHTLDTYTLSTLPVNLKQPVVLNNAIVLNWDKSDIPYFSHYEISYSNFPANNTGYGEQHVIVTNIYDRNTTSFTEANPPYLKNPIYNLHVIDIFGHKTFSNPQGFITSWQVDFEKVGLLPIYKLLSYAIDPSEPILYLYGYENDATHATKIYKFNYESNRMEAVSSNTAFISTSLSIEVVTSANGKEIILEQGGELHSYDAVSMTYKYALKPQGLLGMHDFRYVKAGFWVFSDKNSIYSFSRNGSELTLVDAKPHFSKHQSNYSYSVFEIENKQLLVGHKDEPNSIVYTIDNKGLLTHQKTVPVPIKEFGMRQSQYNAAGHFLINFEDGQQYSTLNFSNIGSVPSSFYANGMSTNGNDLYGTANTPKWSINDTSAHVKEALIYNRLTKELQTKVSIGYPHVIFQNYKGQVFSISSGMKKSDLNESLHNTVDLFVERLSIP